MRTLLSVFLLLMAMHSSAQTQMVFSGDIGLKFNGGTMATPIYVVLDNPSDNAIVDAGAVGGPAISSENEYNIVKWNIGTSTGTYNMPFISPTLTPTYVAASIQVLIPGVGAGSIEFSTYRHDNSLATVPSDVTHMNFDVTGLPGGEAEAMDRFWILDAKNYTTKPGVDVTLYFDAAELDGGMNPNELLIQRFNNTTGSWIDLYIPTTSATPLASTNITIPENHFYRSWTLSNVNSPLPIELLSMHADCKGTEGVELKWTTASEINNSHFSLERSEDGIIWETFADDIRGAGNSSTELSYSHIDNNPFRGLTYYRLTQFDYDGQFEVFDPVVSDCDGVGFEIINAYSPQAGRVQLVVSAGHDEAFDLEILDLNGKVVANQNSVMMLEGLNYFNIDNTNLGYGVYFIKLQSADEIMTRKILLN